ncbi:UDP-glucuronosyltransferase 1A1-like [Xiphias gladius]|uniref:UDP-glucuronosyltransferase 1A1-like n=1 Tax=Xiphias gladius TaxID=8245 RepID=UPI001A9830EF|nr:UDP-glucuronosyltransferase 1A1-like [Xiphias gladius]XP_039999464.1 UDP-glucuronosyltransferase 1A1-like [Xiphias gladius]XP_039999465.1 UDP-glucuronosyltransferase 1A1-like [Xiphias gladius]XP_039999466.1 UDP-glucuronosyltransferase 1A1-like [Xiphias gladius]XP_039999467.1 UDP-glucuronosyltransferase 1A1-like [Xiphias gladius]
MWKAAVLVLLLLNMDMQVNGAVDKTMQFAAEKSRPERAAKTEEAEAGDTILASDSASSAFSGNLLVVPMDGSHWVGMKAVAQEMGRRGHRVTVVIPEVSMRMGPGKHYHTLTHPVPYDKAYIDSVMTTVKDIMQSQPFVEKIKKRFSKIQSITGLIHSTAESLLFNASLISYLAQQGFDAVLTDPLVPTGSLIARKLGIPTINLLRGIPCALDMKSAGCPSPPSYVPRFFTGYTDKMSFKERAVNTLLALLEPLLCRLLYWHFDQIAYQFLGEEVGTAEVLSDSAIWLLRTDLTLEFPRPLMPNVILVGGINCNLRNPLPEDLESWVSGEHGFVVFALGTFVSDLPEEKTSIFLEAFRQIPQKVIWRYTGQVPDNVPENVKMMKWVPQNDLLAHSGVRAFITHAGSHSVFEALCHAVPMVLLPIAGDQPDNAKRLASRGVGVVLDIFSITTESLRQGLNEVINDIRYKENVQKLSALHKDRPADPLDLSVYWTEYVMRHKGAKHLKSAVHDLNWIQYFCLDIIALLATVVLVFGILTVKCAKLCFRKLSRKRKQD